MGGFPKGHETQKATINANACGLVVTPESIWRHNRTQHWYRVVFIGKVRPNMDEAAVGSAKWRLSVTYCSVLDRDTAETRHAAYFTREMGDFIQNFEQTRKDYDG